MRARRVDANLDSIRDAALDLGYLVHTCNDSLADLIVQFRGVTEIWEAKGRAGTFTDLQKKHRAQGWRIRTVRSIADVIAARREIL